MKIWKTSGVTFHIYYFNSKMDEITATCEGIEESDAVFKDKVGMDGLIARTVISKGELTIFGVKNLGRLPRFSDPCIVRFMDEETGRIYEIPGYAPQPSPPDALIVRLR